MRKSSLLCYFVTEAPKMLTKYNYGLVKIERPKLLKRRRLAYMAYATLRSALAHTIAFLRLLTMVEPPTSLNHEVFRTMSLQPDEQSHGLQ